MKGRLIYYLLLLAGGIMALDGEWLAVVWVVACASWIMNAQVQKKRAELAERKLEALLRGTAIETISMN